MSASKKSWPPTWHHLVVRLIDAGLSKGEAEKLVPSAWSIGNTTREHLIATVENWRREANAARENAKYLEENAAFIERVIATLPESESARAESESSVSTPAP